MPVSLDLLQSCGPAVVQEEVLLGNLQFLVFHSVILYVDMSEKFH